VPDAYPESMTRWLLFFFLAASTGIARPADALHVRWRVMLGGVVDSAPVVVKNRLFATMRDGATLAIDASDGRILWRFTTNGPRFTTSAPAYDASRDALYVPGLDGSIHKLDPASGHELTGGGFPARITLAPETEKISSPLEIANGFLYAQTAGYNGDGAPYVGHVVAIRLSDGTETVFNVLCSSRRELIAPQTCNAQRAGLWSRAGVAIDPDPSMHGRIYVATGNGPFDAAAGNYGDSILALSQDATALVGYLTAPNYRELESDDLDAGSSAPALLPRQAESATPLLAVQAGKEGVLRLFDRARLRGVETPLQSLSLGEEFFSAPAVWTNSNGTTYVILGLGDGLRAYRLVTERPNSWLVLAWWRAERYADREGPSPVVAGGVAFVATSGRLIALDAQTGRVIAQTDDLGPIHWQVPAISGTTLYCADESGALTAFDLAGRQLDGAENR
jgi:outer membrane protein assembly factor BamB